MHDRCYSGGSFLRPPRCRFRHREKHQPFITIGETSSRVVVIDSPAAWVTYGMRHWEWWQDKKPPDPHRPVVNLITIVDAVGGLQGLCLGDDEAVFVFLVRICGERYKKRGHLWLPEQVRAFLQDDALVKCGKGIEESLLRIHEDLPITDAGALVAKHVAPEVSVDKTSAMLSWDNFNEVRPSQYYFLQLLLTLSDTMKPRYKGSLQTTNDVRADQPSDAADATSPILTSHIAGKDTIIYYIDTCATWLSDLRVKWDAWVKNLNATGPRQVSHVPIVGIDSEWTATKPLVLVQIGDENAAFVFRLEPYETNPLSLPDEVRSFLQRGDVLRCGVSAVKDMLLIHQHLNIEVGGLFEIDDAAFSCGYQNASDNPMGFGGIVQRNVFHQAPQRSTAERLGCAAAFTGADTVCWE